VVQVKHNLLVRVIL